MSSCCDKPLEHASPPGTLTIALAGNPNSGKTTIFNALTGLRQKVANYPGVTVEKKTGRCKLPDGRRADVIDLPGTYSLISRSPDETVAMEVLRGLRPDMPPPDVVVVVVDASNLQRNLYLVSQLVELGRPMVVALNMMDVAERRGVSVSPAALERELGVPVIPIIGHKRQGIAQLKEAIAHARVAPMPDWPLPDAMKEELLLMGGGLAILDTHGSTFKQDLSAGPHDWANTSPPRAWICQGNDRIRRLDRYQALAERLLIGDRASDVRGIVNQEPVASLLAAAMSRMAELGVEPIQADIEAHYCWIEEVARRSMVKVDALSVAGTRADKVLDYRAPKLGTLTDRVDAILIHRVWGFLYFGLIMATIFVSIFWLAKPLMDGIQGGIDWLGALVARGLPEAGPLRPLVTDGIFKGVGAVVVFVPQIALLFFFLAILEDSGYLARAAFLMDRLLAKVGLHGKSFIPLLSSFACAIPGIMATRTIENRKDRLATILVAPFMSCSARLPVYTLLIGTFFAAYGAWTQAGIMLALYALGIVAAAGTAWIFKRSLLKGPTSAFILEMPTYKLPQWSQLARQVWFNTSAFLTKAGTTIFCLSVVLWAMTYYPRLPEKESAKVSAYYENPSNYASGNEAARQMDKALAAAQRDYSLAGRLGHAMEPVIRPLGFDSKMGIGLLGAFAAREVFVSTMAITYGAGDKDATSDLSTAMRNDKYPDGRPVWTPLVAVSLLVWFVLAMQCMSTLAIVRRETGGWGWPIFMLIYMNGLAYLVSLAVFQVGKMFL
jgi:ferrous iron transport protein B